MASLLDDSAFIKDNDVICVDNRGQTMRDHQGRAVLCHAVEGVLNFLFRVTIERGGCLVQHQDRRTFQDRAGDRHALLLAAGQFETALADHRLVTVRQVADEPVDLGHRGCFAHLRVAGVRAAIADVVRDRVIEQHRVLRDDANGCAQTLLRHLADVLTVDQDAPAVHIIEPEQQPRNGRLARAGRADDRDHLPCRHHEIHAAQGLAFAVV